MTNSETLHKPLVLVVDDDEDMRDVLTIGLEARGWRVATAPNGPVALTLVESARPALVLTDALMPMMDGRELCRLIKKNPATQQTRVVVMTSLYKSVRYRTEAYRQFGVDDYVSKPLDLDALHCAIERLVAA